MTTVVYAGARELLELGLGLLERARAGVGGLGAELERLVGADRAQADARALEVVEHLLGLDVEVVGVLVVEGRADVLPVVGERRLDLLLGGDQERGVLRQRGRGSAWKRSTGSSSATSGRSSSSAAISASSRCSAASSAAGRDLDRVGVAEPALGERREPAERVDLDVEQVDARRAVLGRREDVEDPAADGELAAVLDLVDALVAGGDQVAGDLVEVEQVALADRERRRAAARGRGPSR